jgi:hypothetical protein
LHDLASGVTFDDFEREFTFVGRLESEPLELCNVDEEADYAVRVQQRLRFEEYMQQEWGTPYIYRV